MRWYSQQHSYWRIHEVDRTQLRGPSLPVKPTANSLWEGTDITVKNTRLLLMKFEPRLLPHQPTRPTATPRELAHLLFFLNFILFFNLETKIATLRLQGGHVLDYPCFLLTHPRSTFDLCCVL